MSRKYPRLSQEQRLEAIRRYQTLDRMNDIASDFHVTRQTIFKLLKKAGIDTTKDQRIVRSCNICGKPVLRTRQRARDTTNSYCSKECYQLWMEILGESYKPSSYNSRMARELILKYFPRYNPELGHCIHHINKDCSDNRKTNLMVFNGQGDHVRFHRGFQVTLLWSGATI